MARKRLRVVPPVWPSVVLDSEGLGAAARNEEDVRTAMAASSVAGRPVLVPSVVLAEALTGSARDARINQVLKGLQIVPIDDSTARFAAELKAKAGLTGERCTIDAVVVAVSVGAGGGLIVTSDREDIERIVGAAAGVRIKILHV